MIPRQQSRIERFKARRALLFGTGSAVVALIAGGCSLKGGQDVSLLQGKVLFIKDCAQCHTLARAGAKGVIGPDLDVAFRESIASGLGRTVIQGIVTQQIEYPAIGGMMPKLPLTSRQATDIGSYVQYAAARPGKDTGLLASVGGTTTLPPAQEKNGTLAIAANPTGQLAYTVKQATATAGPITISMTNTSGVPHNLALQVGTGATGTILGKTPVTPSGTHSFKVVLKPGTYTFFCQVPGHRAAGMFGTLTVK